MAFKPDATRAKQKLPFWKDKAKRNAALIGGFIILLMAASGLSMWGGDDTSEEGYDYKGVTFVDIETGWLANLDSGEQLIIASNPRELENLTMIKAVDLGSFKFMEKVYISYNPEDNSGRAIGEFLGHIPVDTRKVDACSKDVGGCEDIPIRVCENASQEYGVIEFRKANITEVTFKNNCLLIQSDSLLKAVDKLILEMKL
ncbi:MAG: hypothetical protein ABIB71_01410 [Candidatus Woesearchaeota archaeon]